MGEKKLHYKMYKDGKKFVFAAIATLSFFVFGGVSTVAVHADTTSGNLTAATVNSTSDTKSAGSSAATVASSASDTKSAGSSAATVASSASDTKSAGSSAATVASSASDTKADSTSASSSSAGKAETTSASSSSAVKSDTASTVSSSAAKSDTASTASSSAAKSDTASTASSGAAKSDTASTASSSAAKSDTASTASSSAAKSDTANTASSSATKSTNVDASESSGTSENTTSSTNNTASSGDDDQSVDMNGIHHYIPLHPERGADPSDNRWGALMKYWDTWYGVGYQVSDSKPASGGPGSPIWPGSGSTAVWPVGSDYASMNRFITRTIEYRDKSTGELITGVTPVVQKVHYGVAFVMDLVTGEILGYMTPNTNGTFPDKPTIQHRADAWYVIGNSNFTAVTSPDLSSKGYLAPDLATVAQQKVNPGDQDDTVNVYYDHAVVPVNPTNPQTPGTPINPDDPDSPKWPVGTDKDSLTTDIHQTIHYQYGDGSQAAPDKTDSTTFEHQVEIDKVTGEVVKDDGWTAKNGKTSFDAVVSPVVPGSVADKAQTAAVTDLNADSADVNETVTYTKVGSLVPSSSDGNFPGAPKVVYPNDPSDATKVTPAGVPTVPGYTAHDPEGHVLTPGSSYQPSDPTKDTTITYTADNQKGSVSYVDDTTGKTLKTDSISGTTGSKSSYSTSGSIADYKKQGYELVTDGYPADLTFDNDDTTDQNFTVHLKHQNIQSTEAKTVTETIHYQGAGNQTPADNTAQVTFTRQVSTDAVTGEKTYGSWSADQSFAAVTSPVIKGYTADKAQIDKQTVNGDSKDLEFTVTYTKTPVAGGNVTAKYVDENGNPIADDVIASGNVGDPYSMTQKDVPGYTFKEVQGNPTGSFTDQDQTVTYVYTKNPATDNNGGTGLNQPGKPGNGTDTGNSSSNQPGNPSQPSNATNNGVINTSTNTGSKVNNGAVNSPELPQTGENNSQSQTMSFIGILLAMFGSLLGFLGIKKRRND